MSVRPIESYAPFNKKPTDWLLTCLRSPQYPLIKDFKRDSFNLQKGKRWDNQNAALELLRRSTNDDQLTRKLIRVAQSEGGMPQKLAIWVLQHSENGLAKEFVQANLPHHFLDYQSLEGKPIHDNQGGEYKLRIKHYPGWQVFIAVDALQPTAGQDVRWGLGFANPEAMTMGAHFGNMVANSRTVAFHLSMFGDVPEQTSAARKSIEELRDWSTHVLLHAAETVPGFQGRGIHRAMVREWASVMPTNATALIQLTEPRSLAYIATTGDFWGSAVGRAYNSLGFQLTRLDLFIEGRPPGCLVGIKKT